MITKNAFIYYESPPVCSKYFNESLRSVKKLFNLKGLKTLEIRKISDLSINSTSTYIRVLLTHDLIRTTHNCKLALDGIGVSPNNIALVRYQPAAFSHTMYLMSHEIAHLFGAP